MAVHLSEIPERPAGAVLPARAPSRRALLIGAGTLGTSLAFGAGTASAAPPTLRKGARGAAVTSLQNRLNALMYWCGNPDASFGHLTQQAVFALQGAAGLRRDGIVGPKTYAALDQGTRPSRRITRGTGFEVDLKRQIIIATRGDQLTYILHTSTGSGERYYSDGRWKTATTPRGDFSMYRLFSSGWQSGPLGNMYRPGYYDRGWAIHGSNSIPGYPASHGCCRISVRASDMLWTGSWFVKGRRVLIY